MPLLLCIETSTSVCSVSLVHDGKILAIRESSGSMRHAEQTVVFIEEVFHSSGVPKTDIDGVAVSGGPGSYTGLRIGVSTAKGLCWALDKPLLAVPTLMAMASGALLSGGFDCEDALLCPMIDARRMEVYSATYDSSLKVVAAVDALIIEEGSFSEIMKSSVTWFFGDGMPKCKSLLQVHPNARFLDDFVLTSFHLYAPAALALKQGRTDHIGLYEPFYFKEFIAGKGSVVPGS